MLKSALVLGSGSLLIKVSWHYSEMSTGSGKEKASEWAVVEGSRLLLRWGRWSWWARASGLGHGGWWWQNNSHQVANTPRQPSTAPSWIYASLNLGKTVQRGGGGLRGSGMDHDPPSGTLDLFILRKCQSLIFGFFDRKYLVMSQLYAIK